MESKFNLAERSLPNGSVVEEGELIDGWKITIGFLLGHVISFFESIFKRQKKWTFYINSWFIIKAPMLNLPKLKQYAE